MIYMQCLINLQLSPKSIQLNPTNGISWYVIYMNPEVKALGLTGCCVTNDQLILFSLAMFAYSADRPTPLVNHSHHCHGNKQWNNKRPLGQNNQRAGHQEPRCIVCMGSIFNWSICMLSLQSHGVLYVWDQYSIGQYVCLVCRVTAINLLLSLQSHDYSRYDL